ncbi:hypothetical protein E9993_10700 [Labilibacter sediminis]|nr:hypothetical protein E9993_10700 [Labilibacter sediminis]
MYLSQETKQLQHKLANYCRTGKYESIEGVSKSRVKQYRRLVFNNVKNTLNQAYPITVEWLSDDDWLFLVNAFFENHDAQTPKIWEMPREFMEYVAESNFSEKLNKPALNDLLLFEWVEIEVHTMTDVQLEPYLLKGDYLYDTLVLAPEYSLQKLSYPVHILNADKAVEQKGDWFIYVFRDVDSGVVQFLNISVLHTFVLEKLYEKPQSLAELLPLVSSIFGFTEESQLKEHVKNFIADLHVKGALIGFRK